MSGRPDLGAGPPATRPVEPPRTLLSEIAGWVSGEIRGSRGGVVEAVVTGVTLSTFRTEPGDLYAALPGERTHGASYADAAVEAGAVAVLTDAAGAELLGGELPVIVVERPRRVLGDLAARLYRRPAADLRMIGVTGTQGKTTTTRLADAGLVGTGVPAAVIGTVGTRILGEEVKTTLTTPEAPDLHALFAVMRDLGVAACAMEVSSHALVMGRVDGVVFDVACFTNLGRDHLDFHKDVEDYFAAKAQLFTPERARLGLVNADDEFGRRLLAEATIPMRSFSVTGPADWRAVDIDATPTGSTFTVVAPDGARHPAGVSLAGGFNVANALLAIAACAEVGYDAATIADGIRGGGGVPGRLEQVDTAAPALVVVDYAHKPDAVTAALAALRQLTDGRLIVVIGAGGERDQGKRPIMGEISARLADLLIVTDDNPRGEDPAVIRAEVLAGAGAGPGAAEVEEIGDRRAAIRRALDVAGPGDVVLIAGKGHESGQEVDGIVHPFDDRIVAAEVAAELYGAGIEGERG